MSYDKILIFSFNILQVMAGVSGSALKSKLLQMGLSSKESEIRR